MKKLAKILIFVGILLILVVGFSACYDPTYYTAGLQFELVDDEYIVTGYEGYESSVVVPSEYGDLPVTGIGTSAFSYCDYIKEVKLPDSIETIGDYAFASCCFLENIRLPDSVIVIGSEAFYNCYLLKSISIPNNIESIGKDAFLRCDLFKYTVKEGLKYLGNSQNPYLYLVDTTTTNIEEANISQQCKIIEDGIFYNHKLLKTVELPNNIKKIGKETFWGCKSLGDIVIPESVEIIGSGAFYDCLLLNSVELGSNLKTIERQAFYNCDSLTYVLIPNSVTDIGDSVFSHCDLLEHVQFDSESKLDSIGYNVFAGCNSMIDIFIPRDVSTIDYLSLPYSLMYIRVHDNNQSYKSIDGNLYTKDGKTLLLYAKENIDMSFAVPSGVTTIGYEAFCNCESLKSITIPNSVTTIGDGAFENCYSLENVNFATNSNLGSIGYETFYNCSSLKNIVVPDSVTSIGDDAFYYCDALIIYCEAESQPDGWIEDWNSFDWLDDYCPVYWYSESEPTGEGNYWRYVDGEPMAW